MARGIIYTMSTVVPGLVKIGKTGKENFEGRMDLLEKNGYRNITGLQRRFAIEVDDYDEKEKLLHTIFEKSKISNTELFAIDIDLVISLLSSLEGNQIYPKNISKNKVFENANEEMELKYEKSYLPEGMYYLNRKIKGFGKLEGKAIV